MIDAVALPKISLHEHLDGCVRLATLLELSEAGGKPLPANGVEGLRQWILAGSRSGSLVDYLRSFDLTLAVMQTEDQLFRVAREYVLDQAADGVIHAEVRWAPELHTAGGLAMEAAVEAVQAGLDAGMAASPGTRVTQILSGMRHLDRVSDVADLALAWRDRGVVAFDLAGPEDGYPASLHADTLDRLARAWMPVTLHAGEAAGVSSIASALLDGHALRLGHGVRIAEDISDSDELGPVATWVRDRQVPLETSPTSNWHTGAFATRGTSFSDHPFLVLDRLGFAVTINTDNRLMSDTRLSAELAALTDAFSLSTDDHLRYQLTASSAVFLPPAERLALGERVLAGFPG